MNYPVPEFDFSVARDRLNDDPAEGLHGVDVDRANFHLVGGQRTQPMLVTPFTSAAVTFQQVRVTAFTPTLTARFLPLAGGRSRW